jgi:regulatory protein
VHVDVDGRYELSVPAELAANLSVGLVLDDEELASLRREGQCRDALQSAYRFLSYRPRSRWEVRHHLESKQLSGAVIRAAEDRLSELGLLDDQAFAQWWVANRLEHQPRGALALRSELRERGVAPEIAEAAVREIDEDDLAMRLALQRVRRYRDLDYATFNRRLGNVLRRRGFAASAVHTAVERAWRMARNDLDGNTAPDSEY